MPRWHTRGLRRWHQSPTFPPPCPHRIPSLPPPYPFRGLKCAILAQFGVVCPEPVSHRLAQVLGQRDHLGSFLFRGRAGDLIVAKVPFLTERVELRNQFVVRANSVSSGSPPTRNTFGAFTTEVRK